MRSLPALFPTGRRLSAAVFLSTGLSGAAFGSAVAQGVDDVIAAECGLPFGGLPTGPSGAAADVARLAEITGAAPGRSRLILRYADTGASAEACETGSPTGVLSLRAQALRLDAVGNSRYESDRNNGAMWSGRGASGALRLGATLAWRGVELTLAPELVYHENRRFDIRAPTPASLSEFAHPLYATIDLPQRMGDDSEWRFLPGQSALTVRGHGMQAGISTENLWGGPAIRYPILLSNTAAGFPHVFFGTSGTPDTRIGRFEARLIWGRTHESAFFDSDETNDWAGLVGWGVSLRPRWLDWLEVGMLRTYHYRARSSFDANLEPVIAFLTPSETNRDGDELASLYLRAVLPESAAEFYGEWARTDRFATIEDDLIPEPDHSQGYTLGFQKLTQAGPGAIRLLGELVHLQEKWEFRRERPLNVFYTNVQLRQGHTHEGQLLGAWVGPGADAQYLEVGYVWPGGRMAGLFAERVRRNDTRATQVLQGGAPRVLHDVELMGGVRSAVSWGASTVALSLAYHRRKNRLFFEDVAENVRVEVELGWWP